MIRRSFAVAVALLAVCVAVAAQQPNPSRTKGHHAAAEHLRAAAASHPFSALSLYQPKIFGATGDSLLFHKGPVLAWSDGGRLASENAMANMAMVSLDFSPSGGYSAPTGVVSPPTNKARSASDPGPQNFVPDGKDLPDLLEAPSNQIYYGGEIGFMYGQWTGKGSGDYMQSYILGGVGNDKFQITAGASYEQSSGRDLKFGSFKVSR
jgi:hypothetical protein